MLNNKFLGTAISTEPIQQDTPTIAPSDKYTYNINAFDEMARSFKNDSLATIAYENYNQNEYDDKFLIDERFDAKGQWTGELEQSIHPDFKDAMLKRAKNKEHFDMLAEHYKRESAIQRELESHGFMKQMAYGFLPEMTNAPLYIGAAMLLPETSLLMGSSAMLRFATSGSAGTAIEGLKDVLGEQDKHALDYAGAVLFDGALGAAFGKRTNTFEQLANDMVLRTHGITSKTLEKVKSIADVEQRKKILSDAYTAHTKKQADNTLLDALDETVVSSNRNFLQRAWGSVRQDLAYVTGESTSPTMSTFAKQMFPDATLQNLDLNNPDLSTQRDLLEETMRGKRREIFEPLIREYVQHVHNSKGGFLGIRPSGQQEREFGNLLGEIQLYRNIDGASIVDAVRKVMNDKKISDPTLQAILIKGAKGMEDLSIHYHDTLAKNGNVDFAEGRIEQDGTYMPFIYNREAIAELRNKGLSKGQIQQFFEQAILNAFDGEIPNQVANEISMAFYRAVSQQTARRMNTFDSILDEIVQSGGHSQDVKDFIAKIQRSKYDDSADMKGNFLNKRTKIDYGHRQVFTTPKGDFEISFRDFLSKDYLNNMDTYVRKMSGSTVLQKFGWDIDPEIVDLRTIVPEDFEKHTDYLKAYADAKKQNHKVEQRIIHDIRNDADLVDMRNRIDELSSKQTNEVFDLIKMVSTRIGDKFDTTTAKQIDNAVNARDYQRVVEIINNQIESFPDMFDTELEGKILNLIENFVTKPNKEIATLSAKHAIEVQKRLDIEIAKAEAPSQFRLRTKADYATLINKVRQELDESVQKGEISATEANKDMTRLDTILKDMTGIATSVDPQGNLNRFYRISHSYNIGRLLGQTFFTMPAEAMNVMWDVGMRNFLDSMPSIKTLLKAYKTGNIDDAQIKEIQDALGMYDEFLSSPRLYEFDHDFNAATNYQGKMDGFVGKAVDKLEAWGENFAEFTLMTGGIKPLTAWFQTAHVMGVMKKMREVADGKAPDVNYKKMIRELGLSDEMEISVYDNIKKHYKDGTMNFDKWDDDTRNVFLLGLKRRTDTLVQMQRLGDKPAWVTGNADYMFKDTFIGKVVMELKQFVMTAYVKQLGRALNRQDKYMIGLIASQMASLTLAYIGKQSFNYMGNQEKYDKAMRIENIIAGTMAMMPQGSVLPMVMNFGSNLMFGQNLIGTSRHNSYATDAVSSLPIMDGISKVIEAFTIPKQVVTGEFDNKTLKPVASLTGVSNHWLSKALWETTQ